MLLQPPLCGKNESIILLNIPFPILFTIFHLTDQMIPRYVSHIFIRSRNDRNQESIVVFLQHITNHLIVQIVLLEKSMNLSDYRGP